MRRVCKGMTVGEPDTSACAYAYVYTFAAFAAFEAFAARAFACAPTQLAATPPTFECYLICNEFVCVCRCAWVCARVRIRVVYIIRIRVHAPTRMGAYIQCDYLRCNAMHWKAKACAVAYIGISVRQPPLYAHVLGAYALCLVLCGGMRIYVSSVLRLSCVFRRACAYAGAAYTPIHA